MFHDFIKRVAIIAVLSLSASLSAAGCAGEPAPESSASEEVGEASQALNCVGTCARIFLFCIDAGEDYEVCASDREACKEDCYANTCVPGEPGCCQGQPTCW